MEQKTSPMMIQWQECKSQAPDSLLFFRLGDFYEAFYEDAHICSKELELTLTKRQAVPMSGIPSHTLDGYIEKLVLKGYKVAIAEQIGTAKETKGLVKREITRIVTAGTLFNSSLALGKSHQFIAAITEISGKFGIAFFDATCADARVIQVETLDEAWNELFRFSPKEVISSHRMHTKYASFFKELKEGISCIIDFIENWRFDYELSYGFLTKLLKTKSLDGFGLTGMTSAIGAAGGLLAHLKETLRTPLAPIDSILPYSNDTFMLIDPASIKHLDLFSKKNSLLAVLDYTETPMGGRLLKRWISEPLLQPEKIYERQDAIEELVVKKQLLNELQHHLSSILDLERLIVKISADAPSPKDFIALKNSLIPLFPIKEFFFESTLLQNKSHSIYNFAEAIALIESALIEDPPLRITDGGAFKPGYNKELDSLRTLANDSKGWMDSYQSQLREKTGIKTLKVGFTKISGFYIEVTRGQAAKIPESFHRRQTLTNAERYTTFELKTFEEKIISSEEKMQDIEIQLFKELKEKISLYSAEILKAANAIGHLDALSSLSKAAHKNHYVRPNVGINHTLEIIDGRHPVIEAAQLQEKFIPNDTLLDSEENRLILITGPNMAGKSTYIRQVALIAIMAQIGSFVPAKKANIDIIDKVFTRIGASDDLSKGQSTFMVEMIETAFILHHATPRSLVILDEIGRGTSTYDGISLAWSIAEFLSEKKPKTLFATHYWELTHLEEKISGVKNFNIAVHENGDQIFFLRKIVRGSADKSYGIHVARLAGIPSSVLNRAEEILKHLEKSANQKALFQPPRPKKPKPAPSSEFQMSLF